MAGYVKRAVSLQKRIWPLAEKVKVRMPRWISTPDGDEGGEWCADCGYFKVRNLRRRDRKRASEYLLDGGWRTEEDHFSFCQHCGVRLDVCLTAYGLDDAVRTFEECGFRNSPEHDAYEITEMIGACNYAYEGESAEVKETRVAVIAIAESFLKQLNRSPAP